MTMYAIIILYCYLLSTIIVLTLLIVTNDDGQ